MRIAGNVLRLCRSLATLQSNDWIVREAVRNTMLPTGSFCDKVALVTGGGTGLGKGIALKFAELGATVAIMSRKKFVLDQAADEIKQKTGSTVIALQADVRDPDQVFKCLEELDERAGVPDIVVNNAYECS